MQQSAATIEPKTKAARHGEKKRGREAAGDR